MLMNCRLHRLHEFVAALDRRLPQPERAGEREIAAEAAELRARAVASIAQLERREES